MPASAENTDSAPLAANGRRLPTPKRKRTGNYRVPPRKDRDGLVIVHTGDGKGKTTAALGIMLRSHGRGMSTAMYQFVKRLTNTGEHRTARRLGISMLALGSGCTHNHDVESEGSVKAQAGWELCKKHIVDGTWDVIILDEITLPIAWGWLDEHDVLDTLARRPSGTHVVLTGRGASQALIDAADLVTDMRIIKHPFIEHGLRAQAGIDL